jgi:hypothetical protein
MGVTATSVPPPISTRYDAPLDPEDEGKLPVSCVRFPQSFLWGAATSAYQIEGAQSHDAKAESSRDGSFHPGERIASGDSSDRACDSSRTPAAGTGASPPRTASRPEER